MNQQNNMYKWGAFCFVRPQEDPAYKTVREIQQLSYDLGLMISYNYEDGQSEGGVGADLNLFLSGPTYPGDRACITRAFNRASRNLWRQGYLLRPAIQKKSELSYTIVQERKGEVNKGKQFTEVGTIIWRKLIGAQETEIIGSADPTEKSNTIKCDISRIINQVREVYNCMVGRVGPDDWAICIREFMESIGAAKVRSDGRVHWVPPGTIERLLQFRKLLVAVGIDMIICKVEEEHLASVISLATDDLLEEVEGLEKESAGFDGSQRPSTYEKRLNTYMLVEKRIVLYEKGLGVSLGDLHVVIGELIRTAKYYLHQPVSDNDSDSESESDSNSNSKEVDSSIQSPAEVQNLLNEVAEQAKIVNTILLIPSMWLNFAGVRFDLVVGLDENCCPYLLPPIPGHEVPGASLAFFKEAGVVGNTSKASIANTAFLELKKVGLINKWIGMIQDASVFLTITPGQLCYIVICTNVQLEKVEDQKIFTALNTLGIQLTINK